MTEPDKLVFQRSFVLMSINSIFLVLLDFIYRSQWMSKTGVLLHAPVNAACIYSVSTCFALIFSLIMHLFVKLFRDVPIMGKSEKIPDFFFWGIFAYINLLYFKFYLFAFSGFDKHKTATVLSVIFILSAGAIFSNIKNKNFLPEDKIRLYFRISLLLAATGFITGLWGVQGSFRKTDDISSGEKKQDHPHIILITCDSLNTRNMSVYGYDKKTTPNLDESASDAVVFKNMITNANETMFVLPAFLGKYPDIENAMVDSGIESPFLKRLKKAGYQDIIFISFLSPFSNDFSRNIQLTRQHTLLERYDFLRSILDPMVFESEKDNRYIWFFSFISENNDFFKLWSPLDPRDFAQCSNVELLPVYFRYLSNRIKYSNNPAFIWAHIFEPHIPHESPAQFHKFNDENKNIQDYDNCIFFLDHHLGIFIRELKAEELMSSCLIILSADHGESLGDFSEDPGDPGRHYHHAGNWINESVARVPLIIFFPKGFKGTKPEAVAQTVDIAPTILDYLGIGYSFLDGESLIPFAKDEKLHSNRVKFCVTASHFIRQYSPLKEKPEIWTSSDIDFALALWNSYKIVWKTKYLPSGENENTINIMNSQDLISVSKTGKNSHVVTEEEKAKVWDRVRNDPYFRVLYNK